VRKEKIEPPSEVSLNGMFNVSRRSCSRKQATQVTLELVFGRYTFRISSGTPAVMPQVSESLHANSRTARKLDQRSIALLSSL
jgi:hypothetical protein